MIARSGIVIGGAIGAGLVALYFLALPFLLPPAVQASPYVTEFTLPTPSSEPLGIAVDQQGTVWVGLTKAKRLLSYAPATQRFQEFAIPTDAASTMIWDVAIDEEGRVWFTSFEDNAVWRFDPRGGEFRRYPVPTAAAQPLALTVARDGTIWFTELRAGKLGRIQAGSDRVDEFPVPTTDVGLGDLYLAPDGAVWFTEIGLANSSKNGLARFEPRTGAFVEFQPRETLLSPTGIAVVAGEVWFAEHGGSLIGKIQPATGDLTRYATARPLNNPVSLPYWLAVDSAGGLWLNEHTANRLARFDPGREVLVEYEVPTRGPDGVANVLQFAIAPNGDVWFTELTENKVGVVKPNIAIPFAVEAGPRTLNAQSPEQVQVRVFVSGNSTRPLTLLASGSFQPSGRLLNMSAGYEPSEFARVDGRAEAVFTLDLPALVKAGDYTLTLGATDGLVVYSQIVRIRIEAPAQS